MAAPFLPSHQLGESSINPKSSKTIFNNSKLLVDTYGGIVHVEWDPNAAVTSLAQLPFFIEFLKLGGLFDSWVEDCPLEMTSRNAPLKVNVLGTLLLSILSGHKRYAHVTSIRSDRINPVLLGMTKIVSEDSLRRGLTKIDQEAGILWLQNSFYKCYGPLLSEPWIKGLLLVIIPRNLATHPFLKVGWDLELRERIVEIHPARLNSSR